MLSIAKFAEAGGVGVETVRFYQRKGLLDTPPKDGGIRRYGKEDLRRLRFIRRAQLAGFTLEEIAKLIALDASHDRQQVRELALTRIAALEAKIAQLQQAHSALIRLSTECGAGRAGPCPILESFGV